MIHLHQNTFKELAKVFTRINNNYNHKFNQVLNTETL